MTNSSVRVVGPLAEPHITPPSLSDLRPAPGESPIDPTVPLPPMPLAQESDVPWWTVVQEWTTPDGTTAARMKHDPAVRRWLCTLAGKGYDGQRKLFFGYSLRSAQDAYRKAHRERRLGRHDLTRDLHCAISTYADLVADDGPDPALAEMEALKDNWMNQCVKTSVKFSDALEANHQLTQELVSVRASLDTALADLERARADQADRAALSVTAAPNDNLSLAYVRSVWPKLTPDQKDEFAIRLLDDLCRPPHERGTAWIHLLRLRESLSLPPVGQTPAEASR